MTAAAVKDGNRRHFDGEEVFLGTSVDEDIYVQDSRGISGVAGGIKVLNKIYGLVQAGRYMFN